MERRKKGKIARKRNNRKRLGIGGRKKKEKEYRKNGYQNTYGERRKRRGRDRNKEGRSVSSECSDWHVTPIAETFPQGVNPAPAKREEKRSRKMATPDARKTKRTSKEKWKYQVKRPKGEEEDMETEGRRLGVKASPSQRPARRLS